MSKTKERKQLSASIMHTGIFTRYVECVQQDDLKKEISAVLWGRKRAGPTAVLHVRHGVGARSVGRGRSIVPLRGEKADLTRSIVPRIEFYFFMKGIQ